MKIATSKGVKISLKPSKKPKFVLVDSKVNSFKVANEVIDMYADLENGFNFYIFINKKCYSGNIFAIDKIKNLEECTLIYED